MKPWQRDAVLEMAQEALQSLDRAIVAAERICTLLKACSKSLPIEDTDAVTHPCLHHQSDSPPRA